MSSVVRVLIFDTVLASNVPKIAKVKYTLKKNIEMNIKQNVVPTLKIPFKCKSKSTQSVLT